MLKEFKEFAVKGNVVDMAVGIIIGGAFGTIATTLVNNVLMPPIGLLIGGVDFSNLFLVVKNGTPPGPYPALEAAQEAGAVTIDYGLFINSVISFLIVALAVFFLVRTIHRLRHEEEAPTPAPTTKDCPQCATAIPLAAKRCPHCTSQLAA